MRGLNIKVEKNIMTITIDLSKEHGPSASGKTTIIGSTDGTHKLEGGIEANISVYKRNPK